MQLESEINLDRAIVKQAIRDIASKNQKLSDRSILYFYSEDFNNLCLRNKINRKIIAQAIKELIKFPVITRKKIANDIAIVIDKKFNKREV
tara:strand:+ start:54 stop:326 length:273 start_codon:yes stop_codon:yes gene_type:complete